MGEDAANAAYEPAIRHALDMFGIRSADIRFVHLSENATFRISEAGTGSAYALRFHRPNYHTIEELRSEQMWTDALAEAGIDVLTSIRARSGDRHVETEVGANGPHTERRWASLSPWLDGQIMREVLESCMDADTALDLFRQLGALLARSHNQATEWTPPESFRRPRLDAAGLMGETPVWGAFWRYFGFTPAQQDLMRRCRDAMRETLEGYGVSPRTFSLIHADLHPGNVMVTPNGLAMIDFDDAGYGWHLYDLAIALIWLRDHPFYFALRDACVSGYREHRPLDDSDLAMLPTFMLARGMAQFGWFHERPEIVVPPELSPLRDWVCTTADAFLQGSGRLV